LSRVFFYFIPNSPFPIPYSPFPKLDFRKKQMTEKPNQPREYDAVLGGQKIPQDAAVLGGIEGVKMRLTAENELTRIAAVGEAMKYGEAGLEVAIACLKDNSPRVRHAVIDLLEQKRSDPKVRMLIEANPLVFFKRTISSTAPGEEFSAKMLVNNKLIMIYRGDITNLIVDVIVSSDDTYLNMGGGVSRRIKQVGGREIYRQVKQLAPISLGQVVVTSAGKLRAKAVFHPAVIDKSNKSSRSSPQVIKRTVRNCMAGARRYNLETIAFPLLATGAGRLEPETVAEAMLSQLKEELSKEETTVKEVAIALYARTTVRTLKLENLFT